MAPRITTQQRANALQLHSAGMSRREVAARVGIAASTVQRLLDNAQVSEKSQRAKQVEALLSEVSKLHMALRNDGSKSDNVLMDAILVLREGIAKLAAC